MSFLIRAGLLALLLLVQGCATPIASGPAPTVVLVSIDGLPADVPGSGRMPVLDSIAREGVQAAWLTPSYPTLTFPNHYTLGTGLRPDRHGIVNNNINDAVLGRFVSKQASARDGRWWGGEPIWVTLQRQGGIAATMFWPGSEAEIAGQRPRYWKRFDGSLPVDARVDQVLAWLDLPPAQRQAWRALFDHYIFDADDQTAAHIPPHAQGVLAPITENQARHMRSVLLHRLNR